jgi:GDPmannose 4,6-dehydratase
MLQQAKPEDFVLATGETTTVREFVKLAFEEVGIEIEWSGRGVDEKGHDKSSGRVVIEISPEFFRPSEVDLLVGDPSKAKRKLGWSSKTSLKELVQVMMKHDLELVRGSTRELVNGRC